MKKAKKVKDDGAFEVPLFNLRNVSDATINVDLVPDEAGVPYVDLRITQAEAKNGFVLHMDMTQLDAILGILMQFRGKLLQTSSPEVLTSGTDLQNT